MERTVARGRETVGLGKTLVSNPRQFPAALLGVLRRSFRTMWKARGGGLYACGFVVAFVWLEINTIIGEFTESDSVGGFLGAQLLEILMRFTVDSIRNTVYALLWPLRIIQISPPWGFILLGVMYLVFPRTLKKPLENWLFRDAVDENGPGEEPQAKDPS
ncbi:MAG: hypothetical protein ACREQZ_02310 [Woeseiaceae bacterium]